MHAVHEDPDDSAIDVLVRFDAPAGAQDVIMAFNAISPIQQPSTMTSPDNTADVALKH